MVSPLLLPENNSQSLSDTEPSNAFFDLVCKLPTPF
jgi:hypothetical protein